MFTGIIECIGRVTEVRETGTNRVFEVESAISGELKVDQSVSHNGVCLTVESIANGRHSVTAIEETLKKTDLGHWTAGTELNLERCMQMNGRLDGHIVQGHVDTTGTCTALVTREGSWEYSFRFPGEFASLVIEKGSIAVNGTSLTCFNVTADSFTVAIIPYTYQHTSIHSVQTGSTVNLEFDLLGKYVQRILALRNS